MNRRVRFASFFVLLVPGLLAAQEGPQPRLDAPFFQGQAMRALDEKVSLLLEQRKNDAAIEELRRVYTIGVPKDHPVYEMKARLIGRLAGLYASAGRKTEALETIKGLLAEAPQGTPAEAAVWLDVGTAYRILGMPDEALKAFDRAIELSNRLAQVGWRPAQGPRGRNPREGPPGPAPGQAPPDRQPPGPPQQP